MKVNQLVCFLCLLLFGLQSAVAQKYAIKVNSTEELKAFLTPHEPKFPYYLNFLNQGKRLPLIAARQGGKSSFPRNSLPAYEQALEYAPVIISSPIQITKDEQLVLFRDTLLEQSTTGSGYVADYTLEELKQFKLKTDSGQVSEYSILTLEEAVNWARGKTILMLTPMLELSLVYLVDQLEEAEALSHVMITAFTLLDAKELYVLNEKLVVLFPVTNQRMLEKHEQDGIPKDQWVVTVGTEIPRKKLYHDLHKLGVCAMLITSGNLDEEALEHPRKFRAYYRRGADILLTEYPKEAAEALRKKFHLEKSERGKFISITE